MNRACVGMEMSSSHCGVTHGRPRRGLRVRPASGASFDELCGVPNISDAHKYCMLQHGLSVAQLGASPMAMCVIGPETQRLHVQPQRHRPDSQVAFRTRRDGLRRRVGCTVDQTNSRALYFQWGTDDATRVNGEVGCFTRSIHQRGGQRKFAQVSGRHRARGGRSLHCG